VKYLGHTLLFLLVLALWGFFNIPVFAGDQENMAKLLNDPGVQQMVLRSAGQSEVLVHSPCSSAQLKRANKITIFKAMEFDSSGLAVAGAWIEAVNEQGCGATRVLNVLAWIRDKKSLTSGALLPGTTRTEPVLQRDGAVSAFQAAYLAALAAGEAKDCKTSFVADTEFIDQERVTAAGAKNSPWREMWTVITCTKRMQVPMRFTPDATGTAIYAGPSTGIKVFPLAAKSD